MNLLDAAIVLFTGRGAYPFPQRSSDSVRDRFPGREGVELARKVEALEAEFYEVRPYPNETLVEASDRAAETFARHHPKLSAEAVAALRWCYAFDWK